MDAENNNFQEFGRFHFDDFDLYTNLYSSMNWQKPDLIDYWWLSDPTEANSSKSDGKDL